MNNISPSTDVPVLKQRSDLHIKRKIWHISSISLVAYLNATLPHTTSLYVLIGLGGLFIFSDCLRLYIPAVNELVQKLFRWVIREHETKQLAGTSWFVVGLMCCFFTLPNPLVTVAILLTAWVDPSASFFGVTMGKHKLANKKSWEGFLAAITVGVMVLMFCDYINIWQPSLGFFSIGFIALLVATVELFTPKKLDDNLTIPVAAGIALYFLSM